MEPTDMVKVSPAMAERLELEPNNLTAGNVMADAIRVAYAHERDPFAGMGYGWADEDREALAWVVGLVDDADEIDGDPDALDERADSAVPIYTAELWNVAGRMRDLFDEDEISELSGPDADTDRRLAVGLYLVARRILEALS